MQNRTYGEYVHEAEALIKRNSQKEALKLLTEAPGALSQQTLLFGHIKATLRQLCTKNILRV
jgi:hypothetical protein